MTFPKGKRCFQGQYEEKSQAEDHIDKSDDDPADMRDRLAQNDELKTKMTDAIGSTSRIVDSKVRAKSIIVI